MLRDYIRQLLAFILFITSIAANAQGFGVSTSARYGDGCRLDFYNVGNTKIYSLRGSELRYTYNSSGQIIVRDESTQITDVYGISGLAALIDSVQSVCLAGFCGGSTTDTNYYTYCGAPLWDFWSTNVGFSQPSDTLSECGGGGSPICILDNLAQIHYWNSGVAYPTYDFGDCLGGAICIDDIEICQEENQIPCSDILSFQTLIGGQTYTILDSTFYCESGFRSPQSILYTFDAALNDTFDLNALSITISEDTTIKNDIFISQSTSALRILGTVFTDINLDTANATITIEAKPVKTSGQTYQTSSFKIQKISYADINAPVINGSTYNPNSGTQSNTFNLTTGKNTFKVSVEDTDGNIAYSIFQVSKTAL